ncbi:CTP-dependent riboflavin kinase [Natronosalvus rutilus]|uniref:Riboflavin kinase n=1 Tax=Natronosalvus rutilus TaxID=2953753 RepID=A0A9E7N8M2_9EURY|nr:CTP-dependent riboflavin kinase [Natronosalvus rutilus]UTF52117.1 CTP-dependent riboflavin kinase [Natronosalvus rutilus]
MHETVSTTVGHDELAVLKLLALDGGLEGDLKISCSALADRLEASNQTASRRLQRLESAGYLERDTVADGQWVVVTDAGEGALRTEYEEYKRLFEADPEVELEGVVTSGMGEGRHYISLPGYSRQFSDRLGYEPFPGTLNVDLQDESMRRRRAMASLESIPIDGWENDERTYGPAVCHPATVETADGDVYETAHAIAPERTHHDEDQLELIAPAKLRDELDLEDGDHVTITVGDR